MIRILISALMLIAIVGAGSYVGNSYASGVTWTIIGIIFAMINLWNGIGD